MVIRCKQFEVACAPGEDSCEECALRILAVEREETPAVFAARRQGRAMMTEVINRNVILLLINTATTEGSYCPSVWGASRGPCGQLLGS
jgi:hypothetical protein